MPKRVLESSRPKSLEQVQHSTGPAMLIYDWNIDSTAWLASR
jgi:hypothetical protein